MNIFKQLKDSIVVDGDTYYHYTKRGKWKSTKWVVWDEVHYYLHDKPGGMDDDE